MKERSMKYWNWLELLAAWEALILSPPLHALQAPCQKGRKSHSQVAQILQTLTSFSTSSRDEKKRKWLLPKSWRHIWQTQAVCWHRRHSMRTKNWCQRMAAKQQIPAETFYRQSSQHVRHIAPATGQDYYSAKFHWEIRFQNWQKTRFKKRV